MGSRPIELPEGVEVRLEDSVVHASGPEGELKQSLSPGITAEITDDEIVLHRRDDTKEQKSQHGLMRSLVENIVRGVSELFSKTLELKGLGYRVQLRGDTLHLELGFSHPVEIDVPEDLSVEVPNNTTITVRGNDRQNVGEFAAKLRHLRDPDPYNQKGIKYQGEYIRKKVGKAVGGGEGAPGGPEA